MVDGQFRPGKDRRAFFLDPLDQEYPESSAIPEPLPEGLSEGEYPPYLQGLNEPQRKAALFEVGPLMVLAGAGSGKTRMLTARMAYLIDRLKVRPYQILAVTFTNKAAFEMKARVEAFLNSTSEHSREASFGQPEIGTFHSIAVRILRREGKYLPFTKPFVIYDDSDQLSLVKTVMKRLNIDTKAFNPKQIQGIINRCKGDAVGPDEFSPSRFSPLEKNAARVYEAYQKELVTNNAVDFGEILFLTYRLFRDHEELRQKYQRRYRYIHVDEYQDTNRVQYLLLMTLTGAKWGGHQNICVVGDEDQSIYKWRGADIRNILDFEIDFPNATVIKLEQNYRSTETIIEAASEVISNNSERKDKRLWTNNPEGEPIREVYCGDERAEAEFVVKTLRSMSESEGRSLDDFAIFYRTHAQSRQFEDILRREKIAYQIVGGLRFYDRKEIKDVLAYFRVILNPSDSVSLARIINVPARGIGKTTLDKIMEWGARPNDGAVNGEGTDLWSGLVEICERDDIVTARPRAKIQEFVSLIQQLMEARRQLKPSELFHRIMDETGYAQLLKKENTPEALARIENLEEFNNLLFEFEEDVFQVLPEQQHEAFRPHLLEKFLEQSSLGSESDQPLEPHVVRLMTLHSSKGLEFPVVFMVGLEEGLFPSTRPWEETPQDEIEEERRLFYVGMTRARERLYLSHAVMRRIWGSVAYQDPARFLAEIPPERVQRVDLTYGHKRNDGSRGDHLRLVQGEGSSVDEPTWHVDQMDDGRIGRRIEHPQYGPGTIIESDGESKDSKVTVEFQYRVKRKFIFKYVESYLV